MVHMKKMSSLLDLFLVNVDWHIAAYSYGHLTERSQVCKVADKGLANTETILEN